MNYRILKGEDISLPVLEKIFALDTKVYGAIGEKAGEDFVGIIDNLLIRFNHNKRTFICLMDAQDNLAGYINFVPITDDVNNEILNGPRKDKNGNPLLTKDGHEIIWDDDLGPNEILPEYIKNTEENEKLVKHNNLFIISVVIDEHYQGRETVTQLTTAFAEYLNNLEKDGYGINSISGVAITADGEKFLRERMFGIRRFIIPHPYRDTQNRAVEEKEDIIEIVYLLDGVYLDYFLRNSDKLYRKTTKDDVYLFLPYENSQNTPLLNTLLSAEDSIKGDKVPDEIEPLLNTLDYCIHYEYKSEIVNELKQAYLGSFRLLHTSDDYPEDEKSLPYIKGEEIVHVSLLAHCDSNIYVVMLCIPNCRYSPSQVEDQLFQDYLMIRPKSDANWDDMDEKGFPKYIKLNDYLYTHYGLSQCGDGKALLCSSGIPADTIAVNNTDELPVVCGRKISQEFLNILTCETYQSFIQDFFVRNQTLIDMASKNRCVYDYYETYMSERMVAFVLNDFSENLSERMELAATYIFIVQLVLLQNTTLNKLNKNVSAALSYERDVSYEYIDVLYRDYAKTIKFWNSSNFKYYGTQLEAEQIKEAFDNEDLRKQYNEQQEFLEHMVSVKKAQIQERNGMRINIFGTIISIIGTQEFSIRLLKRIYEHFVQDTNIALEEAKHTFDFTILGGIVLFFIIFLLLLKKKSQYGLNLRHTAKDNNDTSAKKKSVPKKLGCIFLISIIALAFSFIRPLKMSEGGDVTFFSTVILFLIPYFYGGRVGIISALLFSFVKFRLDLYFDIVKGPIIAELIDYVLGYCVIGCGGFLSKMKEKPGFHLDGFWAGYLLSIFLRFTEGVLNCSYFFNETIGYSIKYCMGYIGIEAVITTLVLLLPKVREAIEYAKELAYSKK